MRIVPILKRGYSLFSPAPINALTVSAFNHIRAEEGEAANSDWLGNALCYAALAGSQPEILPRDAEPAVHRPIPALTAAMDVETQAHGIEVIRFDDAAAHPHAMEWTMTFTHQGRLTKATHKPAIDADGKSRVAAVGCCSNLASATVGVDRGRNNRQIFSGGYSPSMMR